MARRYLGHYFRLDRPAQPGQLALYPPNDRGGSDIVTVEVIEGDFLSHPGTGAEVVLMGETNFPKPEIYIIAITSATHPVPFTVESGAKYRVWCRWPDARS